MPKIVFYTGAGVSAPSGIPTYRDGKDSLWQKYNAEEVCNYEKLNINRNKIRNFYSLLRNEMKDKEPNIHHKSIAALQQEFKNSNVEVEIFTQNIDLLYEKAGCENITHIHGRIDECKCDDCLEKWKYNGENKCPKCGGSFIRPNITLFGEPAEKYYKLKRTLNWFQNGDILIIQGTYGNVFPISRYLEFLKSNGIRLVTVLNNLEPSPYLPEKHFDYIYFENVITAMPKIIQTIKQNLSNSKQEYSIQITK